MTVSNYCAQYWPQPWQPEQEKTCHGPTGEYKYNSVPLQAAIMYLRGLKTSTRVLGVRIGRHVSVLGLDATTMATFVTMEIIYSYCNKHCCPAYKHFFVHRVRMMPWLGLRLRYYWDRIFKQNKKRNSLVTDKDNTIHLCAMYCQHIVLSPHMY